MPMGLSDTRDLLSRLTQELPEVDERSQAYHALERLEAGFYTICEHCGFAIEPERLSRIPHAIRCADCAVAGH